MLYFQLVKSLWGKVGSQLSFGGTKEFNDCGAKTDSRIIYNVISAMNSTNKGLYAFWLTLSLCLAYTMIAVFVSLSEGFGTIFEIVFPFIFGSTIVMSSLLSERRRLPRFAWRIPLFREVNSKITRTIFGLIFVFVSFYWLFVALAGK